MARYVEPMASQVKDMQSHRKFLHGTRDSVDAKARSDKQRHPSIFPYYVSFCHEQPGMFMLTYVLNTTPHHEYISVDQKGFTFRRKRFSTPDKLIGYFKVRCPVYALDSGVLQKLGALLRVYPSVTPERVAVRGCSTYYGRVHHNPEEVIAGSCRLAALHPLKMFCYRPVDGSRMPLPMLCDCCYFS